MAANNPNILVLIGDDVGWFDIGAYHRGVMGTKTPNIDRIAREGALLTDSYAQAAFFVKQHVESFREFPPRQAPAGFNPEAMIEGILKTASDRD